MNNVSVSHARNILGLNISIKSIALIHALLLQEDLIKYVNCVVQRTCHQECSGKESIAVINALQLLKDTKDQHDGQLQEELQKS